MTPGHVLLVLIFAAAIGVANYFDWTSNRRVRSDNERFADAILSGVAYLVVVLSNQLRSQVFVELFGERAAWAVTGVSIVIFAALFKPAKNALMQLRR